MALSGNKGEWSGIYALFKLLGERTVYAGDENLEKIKNLFYPIVMILRQEKDGDIDYVIRDSLIHILSSDGRELLNIPAGEFLKEAGTLFRAIQEGKGSFSIPDTETFMEKVRCKTLKAPSTDKTDIRIVLHDCRAKTDCELGFSIKSQLGNPSTLLNASRATNFIFRIEGVNLSDEEITEINSLKTKQKIIDRFNAIKKKGGSFVFEKVDSLTFENNLILLDGALPEIISHLLLGQLKTGDNYVKDLTDLLVDENPIGYRTGQNAPPYYEYKVKQLLTAIALGMVPATSWKGIYDANGGYLVVKTDGDVLVYHFYDRNRFEDYLFHNAFLDRSSTTRNDYGKIERASDGSLLFKMNLQIRLKQRQKTNNPKATIWKQ